MESEVRPTHRGGAGLATAPAPDGPPPSAPMATAAPLTPQPSALPQPVAEVERLLPGSSSPATGSPSTTCCSCPGKST